MNSVLIAHLKMQQPAGGAEPQQLMRRQAEMLLDLYRYLRRLSNLWHGELRTTWVARADAIWLRLDLVPRKQGLLFDPLVKSRSRPATLLDEAEALRKELLAIPTYAKQAAAGLREWAAREVLAPLDPMHELAYRRSKTQWIMEMDIGQRCLDFPDVERYIVDAKPTLVSGTVCSVSLRVIELRQLEVKISDAAVVMPALNGRLRIVPCVSTDVAASESAWSSSWQYALGKPIDLEVFLHRCILSHRIVGAVATEDHASIKT